MCIIKNKKNLFSGALGSCSVHQVRKSHRVAAVRGDDPHSHRGSPGCLSETDEHGEAAHFRRDGQRALCVSAVREALHGPRHHEEQQHIGGLGDATALLSRGTKWFSALLHPPSALSSLCFIQYGIAVIIYTRLCWLSDP